MSIHNENYSANSTELPRVAVLMSTYNGEIFIREQIESILAQEGVAVSLYVRDDGSSDQTFEILKEYEDAGNLKILPEKECRTRQEFYDTYLCCVKAHRL